MIQVNIKMAVPREKLKEILQTFNAMLGPIRDEKGCLGCNCYLDVEADNHICFIEEWKGGAELKAHLRSVHFGVLAGAMKLLVQQPEIRFQSISSTAGAEAIEAARKA